MSKKTSIMLRVFEIALFMPKTKEVIEEIPKAIDLAFLKVHQHFYPEPVPGGIVVQAYNQLGELLLIPGIMSEVKVKNEDGSEEKIMSFTQSLSFSPVNISRILQNVDIDKLLKTVSKYQEGNEPPFSQFLHEICKDGVVISEFGQIIETSKMLS